MQLYSCAHLHNSRSQWCIIVCLGQICIRGTSPNRQVSCTSHWLAAPPQQHVPASAVMGGAAGAAGRKQHHPTPTRPVHARINPLTSLPRLGGTGRPNACTWSPLCWAGRGNLPIQNPCVCVSVPVWNYPNLCAVDHARLHPLPLHPHPFCLDKTSLE